MEIFRIATTEIHFIINGSIFVLIDGVAMGPPLVSVLANLFLGFHQQSWIKQATNVRPIFYNRYLNDIFGIFKSESHADTLYSYSLTIIY